MENSKEIINDNDKDLVKYEILNPVSSTKKPHYDKKRGLFVFPIKSIYKYYIEVAITSNEGVKYYYLFLSKDRFNSNCRICHVDQYGRCKIKVNGQFKQYIINELKDRPNLEVNYVETTEDYDIFIVE